MVSIYKNIFDTTSRYTISVQDALKRIAEGKSANAVISLRNEENEAKRNAIKSSLPSITFSGKFSKRTDECMTEHSGFICLDFDKINIPEYIEKFKNWESTYACWISPSGKGIKVLVKIADPANHKKHFDALVNLFPLADEKCGNLSRVCYESYDPNIFINEEAKVFAGLFTPQLVKKQQKAVASDYDNYRKLVAWLERTNRNFVTGNRNAYIYVLAGAMCRFGFNESDAIEFLLEDYMSDDFNNKEIVKTIQSAYKKNRDNAGSVEFMDGKMKSKDTQLDFDPKIFEDGFKTVDIISGADVYAAAIDIYENGYKSAESTFIPKLDEHFKFKRGELTVLSGIGNYGKSNYLYQLLLIKSLFNGDKWAIFSPEHFPAEEFYLDQTEALLGCAANGSYQNKPPRDVFDKAYEFTSEHFKYIYPETIAPSPEYIKSKFFESIIKYGVSGVVIDPFNQLTNDYAKASGRSDKYLETFLSDCKHFAQVNNVFFLIVAHPHKLQKESNGNYPCPDVFDLADGAMWNNKADNILIYHRPLAQSDPDASICEHHSKKIKRQKQVGKRGSFDFDFRRMRRRFYFDGKSPLDGNRFEYGSNQSSTVSNITSVPDKYTEPKKSWEDEDAPF